MHRFQILECLLVSTILSNNYFLFQILLESKTKLVTERGTSESTSGCESGQNYESDENEGNSFFYKFNLISFLTEKKKKITKNYFLGCSQSAKSANNSPESCSSENISKDNDEFWHHNSVDGAAVNVIVPSSVGKIFVLFRDYRFDFTNF